MKAIILAAGSGRRMRPLSDREHKTLLRIGSKTIISRIVDGLMENGIDRIVIGTGYMAGRLESYLTKKYPAIAFTFINNARFNETNNIHTLALVFSAIEIDEDIILIESDLIYEPSVIRRIIRSEFANVALVDKYRSGLDGTVVGIAENRIVDVFPPHLQGSRFDFTDKYKTLNIYKFSSEFCNSTFKKLLKYYSEVIDDNCYYELILGILIYIQRETIYAEVIADEKWAEVDDPNDLKVAEFIFSPQRRLVQLQESCGGYWNHDILDFGFIRNMYFPNSSIFSEIRNNLESLALNYGSRQSLLNQKLAYFLCCDPQRVQALNGASQIYPLLASMYAQAKVLIPVPTFGEYPRAFPQAESYPDRVGIDVAALAAQAAAFDVIIIVNPNNPTGSVVSTDWIYGFVERNPGKTIIVDESFIEFSGQPSLMGALEARPLKTW
jgi:choline kinase